MREEKSKIMLMFYFLGFIVIFVGFLVFYNYVNLYYVGAAFLLAQQAYVLPRTSSLYHKLNGLEANVGRFVTLYNEVQIFTPGLSRITLVMGIILYLLIGISLLPLTGSLLVTQVVVSLFGEIAGMNYVFYLILFSIIVYILLNIIRGMGFIEIKRYVERVYTINFGAPPAKIYSKFQYVMFLFPVLRTIALATLNETMTKMVEFNEVQLEKSDSFEETFELSQ